LVEGKRRADVAFVLQPSFVSLDSSAEAETHLGAHGLDGFSERLDRLTEN
jgi:hypothetical protein